MNLIYLFSISLLTELTSILFETPPGGFLPLIALICLLGYLPAQDKIALALQCIGFSGIGLFLVSIHAQREKRI